jgi:hypothetical protein
MPFEPRGDRPVYFQDYFRSRKRDSGGREVVAIAVNWERHFADGGHLAGTEIATSNS